PGAREEPQASIRQRGADEDHHQGGGEAQKESAAPHREAERDARQPPHFGGECGGALVVGGGGHGPPSYIRRDLVSRGVGTLRGRARGETRPRSRYPAGISPIPAV